MAIPLNAITQSELMTIRIPSDADRRWERSGAELLLSR
jgi:hypothetical protein